MALPDALGEEFSRIVGREFLMTDADACRRLSRTTLPSGTLPLGVIRPADRPQIQQILRCASQHKIPVYPVSTGKNWGYGDACAPTDGCLILDLSRLNRIIEVNTTLAYAVVEPGVTQGALAEYLEKNNLPLVMDSTGAGPEAGIVGNILERGFGHSKYGDRFLHSCNYEIVMADGSIIQTGFGSFSNAQAQHVYKWGVGPSLDGLATQSHFGVVTRVTVWLMPKPAYVNYYYIGLSEPSGMAELAERLRPLYLSGTLRSVLHCFNHQRLLTSSRRFPWDEADGTAALEVAHPDVYQRLYKEFNLLAWSCAGLLTGSRDEVHAARRRLRQAMKGIPGLAKFFFLSEPLYEWSQRADRLLPSWKIFDSLHRDLSKVRGMVSLLRGKPSYQFLSGAHWRARGDAGPTGDPLNSDSGLIWLGPVLPTTAKAVEEVNVINRTVLHQFGFEDQITYSFLNERSLAAILSISFDHRNASETERARQCEMKLLEALLAKGYVPYRGSASVQRALAQMNPEYARQVGALQRVWDANGILAPGRYSA